MEGGCQKLENGCIPNFRQHQPFTNSHPSHQRKIVGVGEGKADRFIDPRPRTDNIRAPKLLRRDGEHSLQLRPFSDVGLLENGAGGGGGGGMGGDESAGFGAEGEVGEEDVAVAGEEGAGEVVVYALVMIRLWGGGRGKGVCVWEGRDASTLGRVPEPAPVMMAVLPARETAIELGGWEDWGKGLE